MRTWLGLAALIGCFLAGAPVRAQMIEASDAGKLATAMQGMGWQAKLGKDGEGDPLITSKISRTEYVVQFYGCTDHTKCGSVLFSASYNVKKKMTAQDANAWNMKKRFGSVTIDKDGDPRLTMSVNLFGGVSAKNFEDTVDYWRLAVTDFEKQIDW